MPNDTKVKNDKKAKKEEQEKDFSFNASEGFAPVPEEHPEQQRALSMVRGKLLIVDAKKNQGILQIEGENYPCTFRGRLKPDLMAKRVNQELCFTAWPTGQIPSPKKGQPPLILLQLHNLRKQVAKEKNGFSEIRGFIHTITKQSFQINIHSEKTQDTYAIQIYGKCTAKVGDFVKVEGLLTPKGLKLLQLENLNSIL